MDKNIQQFGLDQIESKVYLALLELGPSSVSEITKKASITRTLGYHVLQKLSIYGLVNEVSGKGSKMIYSAGHPNGLVQYVKNKKNSWEKKLEEAERLLPNLVSLYKIVDKPTVRYQDGLPGVKNIFNETLESKTEILSILDIEGWDVPELSQFGKEYNRQRSERKIKSRILMLDTPQGRDWMKYYKGSFAYTDYRWIKPEQVPGVAVFGGEVNVYEDKVVMILLKKPNRMGIMIESEALSNILKGLFELAWQVGVPARKKK
jgi:sugar-specific transcriptional regulator TrmB